MSVQNYCITRIRKIAVIFAETYANLKNYKMNILEILWRLDYFVTRSKSWTKARAGCNKNPSSLVLIDQRETLQLVGFG